MHERERLSMILGKEVIDMKFVVKQIFSNPSSTSFTTY